MIEIGETDNLVAVNSYRLELLIRDSERLAVIKGHIRRNKYVNKEELMILLGMCDEEDEEKDGEE